MSSQAATALENNPQVAYVEHDQKVQAIDQTLPAGIDRIGIDNNSTAKVNGTDDAMEMDIAIIDTGIDLDHPDLDMVDAVNCIDADGDLESVVMTLYELDSNGNRIETEDSASIDVSGSDASGTTGFKAKFDEDNGKTL